MKKILLLPAIVIASMFFLLVGSIVVVGLRTQNQIDRMMAQIEEEGATLRHQTPHVEEDRNAAPIYEGAFRLLQYPKDAEGEFLDSSDTARWAETHENDVRVFLRSNQPALRRLREAATYRTCVFADKWDDPRNTGSVTRHLEALKKCARLLAAEGAMRAHDGDVQGALDSYSVGLRLTMVTHSEPMLLSGLWECVICGIIIGHMEQHVPSVTLAPKLCTGLIDALRWAEMSPSRVQRFFQGERLYGIGQLDSWMAEPKTFLKKLGFVAKPWAMLGRAFRPALHTLWRREKSEYIRFLSDCVRAAGLPRRAAIKAITARESLATSLPRYCIMTRTVCKSTSMSRALIEFGRQQARCRAARIALALKCHKARRGAYPESLEQLESDVLPVLPCDPFTERAFRYKREGEGFVLYSLGPNGIDDGGTGGPHEGDVPFRFAE